MCRKGTNYVENRLVIIFSAYFTGFLKTKSLKVLAFCEL